MQKCLHLAIENEDIISGSELKVDMEEEINKFLVSDMFDEAKKSFNELSNAHHLNILNDRNYFYIDEDDLRHALKVNEIVAIGDYDVQNDINIDLVNWVKTIKHEIEHINKHDPKDFRDISRCCDDLIKLINGEEIGSTWQSWCSDVNFIEGLEGE